MRAAYGLINDGKTNTKGILKNLFHLALLFEMGETYLPGLPYPVQKGLFGFLARVGKWLGVDKQLEKYYAG